MESKRRIKLTDLIYKLQNDIELSEDDLAVEESIGKPYCDKYQDPREHLKNFANAYIVESAFKDLYQLEFNDIDYHEYLIEGHGSGKADLHYGDCQIEAKYFRSTKKFFDWLNGTGFYANHNADVILVYCDDSGLVYAVFTKDKTFRLANTQPQQKLDLFQ